MSIDYSAFDRPDILSFVFFPRQQFRRGPVNALDMNVPVAEGVSVSCRFYVNDRSSPTILFFHGNGEVVSDYDGLAPIYNRLGMNLLVADYRGYGASGGSPSFTTMLSDAGRIFMGARDMLKERRHSPQLFVMGRSMGSLSALKLGSEHQDDLAGMIIESGFASPARLLEYVGARVEFPGLQELEHNVEETLRSIRVPALIIHGQCDELIPSVEAEYLFDKIRASDKRLVIIPGAGHNDLMEIGMKEYFEAIKEFVERLKSDAGSI